MQFKNPQKLRNAKLIVVYNDGTSIVNIDSISSIVKSTVQIRVIIGKSTNFLIKYDNS